MKPRTISKKKISPNRADFFENILKVPNETINFCTLFMKAVKGGEYTMDKSIIAEYTDKVYAYAVSKTFSNDEAEELSQEILLTAISELSKLRDESRFEPWLWSLASNVAKMFRRGMGK